MGLFKFMRDAGAKLFGGGEAKAATPEVFKKEVSEHGSRRRQARHRRPGRPREAHGRSEDAGGSREDHPCARQHGRRGGSGHERPEGAAPAPEAKMYTVKKGDTLWKIAELHYGKVQGA